MSDAVSSAGSWGVSTWEEEDSVAVHVHSHLFHGISELRFLEAGDMPAADYASLRDCHLNLNSASVMPQHAAV